MDTAALIRTFESIVGPAQVKTQLRSTEHYRTGWRSGGGQALAVVFPQHLLDCWRVLQACVEADCIIIMQAANTGLTEGSTPSAEGYDRDIVIINTLQMNQLMIMGKGEQVISFPGTTLHTLEQRLIPLRRAPHSVIGSSCLGASIVGGVANNSGGALVKRGPAYTEMALFARVDENNQLHLVNHLGIELGDTPEAMLTNLETGNFDPRIHSHDAKGSASDYERRIRDVDADTPSRFNADPTRLFEASGCAGKIAVFALRLDTFPVAKQEQTFYVGTNDPSVLADLRRSILSEFEHLPEVGEYMHRDVFKIAKKYGKDTFLSVKHLGTKRLPQFFSLKGRIDSTLNKISWLPSYLTDRTLQVLSRCFGNHLPPTLLDYEQRFEHHLILKMSDAGIAEARKFLSDYFAQGERGEFVECDDTEASSAYLHRFAAAGAAMRYQTLHEKSVGDILALDIALRRNDLDWVESLPKALDDKIEKRLYYGHFFCHVFHQDYIIKKGYDAKQVKAELLALLDERGARYPAEHNVGHLYKAAPALQDFYRQLDPTNRFNPGVGQMDKHKRNCSCC